MSNELLERLKQNEQQLKQMEKTLEAEISSKSLPADEIKKRQEKLSKVRNSIKNTEAQLSEFGISKKADSVSAPEKSGGNKVGLIAAVILSGVIIAGIIIMLIVLFPQNNETDVAENNAPYNPTATEEQKKLNLNGDKKEKGNKVLTKENFGVDKLCNEIVTDFDTKYAGKNIDFSLYIKDLKTGEKAVYNNHKMNSAGLIKLFIMNTAFLKNESGENPLTADEKTAVKRMIEENHNESSSILIDKYGMETINSTSASLGYNDSDLQRKMYDKVPPEGPSGKENYTSVENVGRLLENIYLKKDVSPAADETMYGYLKRQQRTNKISAKLKKLYPELTIANKTGELSTVENDAAIISGKNCEFVLVVMVNDIPKEDGYALKKEIQNTISDIGVKVAEHFIKP